MRDFVYNDGDEGWQGQDMGLEPNEEVTAHFKIIAGDHSAEKKNVQIRIPFADQALLPAVSMAAMLALITYFI